MSIRTGPTYRTLLFYMQPVCVLYIAKTGIYIRAEVGTSHRQAGRQADRRVYRVDMY